MPNESSWDLGRPIFRRLPEEGYQDNEAVDWVTKPVDDLLMDIKGAIASFEADFIDPATAKPENLDWLAQHHGYTGEYWNPAWDVAIKRQLIADAFTKVWPNKGRRSLLEYFLALFAIRGTIYQVGVWWAGISKPGDTAGTGESRYYVLMPLGDRGYLRTSYEWKLVELLIRLYMPAQIESRVCYRGFIPGFSVPGDLAFAENFDIDPD